MKHKIFSHTSLLIILSVILTFLAAGTVMYNRYDIYMKQGVRDEAAYIKTGLEEDGQDFLTDKVGDATSSRTTATDQSLLKLRKRDSVKWSDILIPCQNRLSIMR